MSDLRPPRSTAADAKRRASQRRIHATTCVLTVALLLGVVAGPAAADIDGDTFTSTAHHVRAEIPRGWRVSESSGYPNILFWMSRSRPRVKIAVVFDPIVANCAASTSATFCSHDATLAAAAVRPQIAAAGFTITAQEQSRTPELEYQTDQRYVRHALVVVGDLIISVIMTADSPADRIAQSRTFERLTQSVRSLTTRGP